MCRLDVMHNIVAALLVVGASIKHMLKQDCCYVRSSYISITYDITVNVAVYSYLVHHIDALLNKVFDSTFFRPTGENAGCYASIRYIILRYARTR